MKIAYILSLAHFEAKPYFYRILTNSVTRGRELPKYVLDCRCFRVCSVLSLKTVKCFTEKWGFFSKHLFIRQILKDFFFMSVFTEQTLGLVDISVDSASVVNM